MYWQRNLRSLSIGAFIANISFTMFLPFFPNMLVSTGLKDNISLWTGILVSASFLASGLVAPVWGSLADRYGKRIMLARSGYGLVVIAILMAFAGNHWQLLLCRILYGFLGGFIPTSIMLTVSNTPQDKMGFALGIINSFIAIGSIMGPFVGGALVQYIGIKNNMLASAGILFAATTISILGTEEKIHKQTERTTVFQDLQLVLKNRMLQVFFVSMVVLHISTFMFTAMLPLRVSELAVSKSDLTAGIMFSLTGIAMALGSVFIGRIKSYSYNSILLVGLISSGVLCI
ncbi:MAG: MFS transporter, partial [Firmicutes bacterium]|nr:MFS transporter [Bacillota bacterium]